MQFTFQDHTSFVGGRPGAIRLGLLSFTASKDDADDALSCPSSRDGHPSIYRVIYPTIAAVAPRPAKPKKAAGRPAAATPQAATATATATGDLGTPPTDPAHAATTTTTQQPQQPPAYSPPH